MDVEELPIMTEENPVLAQQDDDDDLEEGGEDEDNDDGDDWEEPNGTEK